MLSTLILKNDDLEVIEYVYTNYKPVKQLTRGKFLKILLEGTKGSLRSRRALLKMSLSKR